MYWYFWLLFLMWSWNFGIRMVVGMVQTRHFLFPVKGRHKTVDIPLIWDQRICENWVFTSLWLQVHGRTQTVAVHLPDFRMMRKENIKRMTFIFDSQWADANHGCTLTSDFRMTRKQIKLMTFISDSLPVSRHKLWTYTYSDFRKHIN